MDFPTWHRDEWLGHRSAVSRAIAELGLIKIIGTAMAASQGGILYAIIAKL